MKNIVLIVTSDIVTDQRVNRTATTLFWAGYNVLVIGRSLKSTPKRFNRDFRVKLLHLPFSKGVLFYFSFNLWVFFYLLFRNFDLIYANDLDTLLAARTTSWIKRKPLIYDSHELFTELPELVNRRLKKKIWFWLEKWLSKGIKFCSTVSDGVAIELNNRYGLQPIVIRNLPFKQISRNYKFDANSKIVIYQGALNIGRGLEKLVEALLWLPDVKLLIVGSGDIEKSLVKLTEKLNLTARVTFTGRVSIEELNSLTRMATLGVSLEEDMGLNYRYALPNKLFDYIQAELPVLTTNLPEMESIVNKYNIGQTIQHNCSSKELAYKLNQMLGDKIKLMNWHTNALIAAEELCWENEKNKLIDLISTAL